MAVIKYTAKRSLMAGHTSGTEYQIEIGLTQYDTKRDPKVSVSTALAGRSFTTLHRVDISYNVQTVPTDDATTIDNLVEFMASVEGGETFQIDEKGTIAAPDTFATFKLKGRFTPQRVGRKDRYSLSFEAKA